MNKECLDDTEVLLEEETAELMHSHRESQRHYAAVIKDVEKWPPRLRLEVLRGTSGCF